MNTNVNHNQDGLMTPKSKAIDQIQKQLEASHAQLKELASRHMVPAQAPISEKSDTNQEEKKVLQGKNRLLLYSKTCVKRPLKIRQNKDLYDKW